MRCTSAIPLTYSRAARCGYRNCQVPLTLLAVLTDVAAQRVGAKTPQNVAFSRS
jgi:hypothetical protein